MYKRQDEWGDVTALDIIKAHQNHNPETGVILLHNINDYLEENNISFDDLPLREDILAIISVSAHNIDDIDFITDQTLREIVEDSIRDFNEEN